MSIRKAYLDTSGGQVHFHMAPGNGLPVVFLHQTASSGRMCYAVFSRCWW